MVVGNLCNSDKLNEPVQTDENKATQQQQQQLPTINETEANITESVTLRADNSAYTTVLEETLTNRSAFSAGDNISVTPSSTASHIQFPLINRPRLSSASVPTGKCFLVRDHPLFSAFSQLYREYTRRGGGKSSYTLSKCHCTCT